MKGYVLVFAASSLVALPSLGSELTGREDPQAAAGAASGGQPSAALCSPEEPSHRELGGHLFLPSHLAGDPFSVTAFVSNFALGEGQVLGPSIVFSTYPPTILRDTKWYGYNGLAQQFELDVRILEYLSLRTALGANAYLGTAGLGSTLVVGAGLRLNGNFGVKGSLPIGEHLRLAISIDAQYGPVYTVLVLQGIIDAINSRTLDPRQLLQ